MTLPTMKAGDRVRITVEGEVITQNCLTWSLRIDGQIGDYGLLNLTKSELTAPTARVEVLPPPIDPDLVLAREVVIDLYGAIAGSDKDWPDRVAAGIHDNSDHVRTALAAIKASKAGGRV